MSSGAAGVPPASARTRATAIAATCWIAGLTACGPAARAAGGCAASMLPGDLVITEVFADFAADGQSAGTDTGKEWFEIYNTTAQPIDLAGLRITASRPDGSRASTHAIDRASIAPGQFFTLGSALPDALPPYIDYGYGTDLGDLFNSEGGVLALSCGEREIDRAGYTGVKPGHSRELTSAEPPDYTRNDDPASWCEADSTAFEPGNFGTPGTASDCRPAITGQCDDGGTARPVAPPAPGQLVISEILANPANVAGETDATREWFEIANLGDGAFDLNELQIGRIGAPGAAIASASCLAVAAHGFAVLARSADPQRNGMLPQVLATFRFALVDTSGDIEISRGDAVLDSVRWSRVTSGVASQLDPSHLDTTANDDPASFCAATDRYGDLSNLGTPGAANRPCP